MWVWLRSLLLCLRARRRKMSLRHQLVPKALVVSLRSPCYTALPPLHSYIAWGLNPVAISRRRSFSSQLLPAQEVASRHLSRINGMWYAGSMFVGSRRKSVTAEW